MDPYGRWALGHRVGTITGRTGSRVLIQWDDDGTTEQFAEGDVRYAVDTERARITAPVGQTILDAKRSAQ